MESITLYPSRMKWSLMLLGSIAFVVAGWFIIKMGGAGNAIIGWIGIAFFGLGIPISLLMLVPGLNALTLTPEGFSLKHLGRTRKVWNIKWSDISEFSVMEMPKALPFPNHVQMKKVGMNYAPSLRDQLSPSRIRLADWNRRRVGCDGALPDTYGLKVEELVTLLNEWRTRHSPR